MFEFENFSEEIKQKINNIAISWLYDSAGEVVGQTVQNSKRDTGKTAGSYEFRIDEKDRIAHVGSNMENAIWEEFGTGQYALKGNGRKTPWSYQDQYGKWHTTKGKKPRRVFFKAYESKKTLLQLGLEKKLKEGLK